MNEKLKAKFESVGVLVPKLVMPREGIDLSKYSVVACDQYTSQKEYWEDVRSLTNGSVTALDFIMPEAWLNKKGEADTKEHQEHQESIPSKMKELLSRGDLRELTPGMMYVSRTLSSGDIRCGLVLALDLEQYDYNAGSHSLIRATEKTVAERIPARAAIRAKAVLECPHIMVLYADKKDELNSALKNICENKSAFYSFELMKNSGYLEGYHITADDELERVADILIGLKENAKDGMLFAIGDGNHSLAAAKMHWENIKKDLSESQRKEHPARYALVELVNLYDEGLGFEPINRVLYDVDPKAVQEELCFDANNPESIQTLQPKLDECLKKHKEASIDYIHGKDVAKDLEAKAPKTTLAICFEGFDRDSLFSDVIKNGCLVRKSFSMGHAEDKRFYLEARKI